MNEDRRWWVDDELVAQYSETYYWEVAIQEVYGYYWATDAQVDHIKRLAAEPYDTPKRRKARKARDLMIQKKTLARLCE